MISFVPWISNWASNYKLYWLISDPREPRKIVDKLYKKGCDENSVLCHGGRLAYFYWQGRSWEPNWNTERLALVKISLLTLSDSVRQWHDISRYLISLQETLHWHWLLVKAVCVRECCDFVIGEWWILFFQYCSESRWPGLNKYFKRDHQCFCSEKPGNVEIDCKIKFKTFSSSNKDIERMFL